MGEKGVPGNFTKKGEGVKLANAIFTNMENCIYMSLNPRPNTITSHDQLWGRFHKMLCTLRQSFTLYAELLRHKKLLKSWA